MNRKNERGITLVALIVAVIVMLILASVTLNTTFTAYETTRAEKFKAQMKVLQESATLLNSEFLEWQKEKEEWYRDDIRNRELANEEIPENEKINSDGTLPLYFYEIYNTSSFFEEKKSNLKNVDGIIASDLKKVLLNDKNKDGQDYFDANLRNSVKADFYNIPHEGNNLELIGNNQLITSIPRSEEQEQIEAGELIVANANIDISIDGCTFYEFDKDDLEYYLGARNIEFDKVYINFDHLFIFTTDSVKVDGEKLYTQYAFSDSNTIHTNDTKSTISNASILVDVVANYGTSQKISLTLSSNNQDNNNMEYRIRKAYYKNNYTINGNNDKGIWYEVDDLKECKYSEDGKSVTFIVYESGDYNFSIEDVSGGYTDKIKQNVNLNIRNSQPKYEPIVQDKDNTKVSGYNITLCNAPVLNPDMIPVKWVYSDENEIEGKWVVCTTIDPEWYNYSKDYKMWANIMFDHDKNTTKELKPGVELSEAEMGSMFVWIPRFYGGTENEINFLRGTSRTTTTGQAVYANNVYGDDAFRNTDYYSGGWDSELKGLWFAKYDTGLEVVDKTVKNIEKVNTSKESVASIYNKLYSNTQNSDNRIVRAVSKPYYITWRNISYTNAFSQALMYYNNFNYASKEKDLNTHLMKNSELKVLYEITRSKYYGNLNIESNSRNKLSAGSDGVNGYSFQKEVGLDGKIKGIVNQSSTGNITGIYDVIGTTSVMLSDIGVTLNQSEYETEFLYNNLMQKINVINNVEKYADITDSDINEVRENSTKYYTIAGSGQGLSVNEFREGEYFIKIGERANQSLEFDASENWTKLSQTVSPNYGFRIVISNSPSGDRSNYLYDSSNITEIARDDLPGFYVTDENGNYKKNADGKFLDSDGNKTFYSWSEMKDNDWIRVENGVVKNGNKINDLKQKTGILKISDSEDISVLGSGVFESWYKGAYFSYPQPNGTHIEGSLLKVEMGDNIKEIQGNCFSRCENLKSIKVSNSLTNIGEKAFYHCKNLVNYSLPDSLEIIGTSAFANCSSIESIIIPRKVSRIDSMAFTACSNVGSLEILSEQPDLRISFKAFSASSTEDSGLKIKSLVIPGNVSHIEAEAFYECTQLENVKIKDGVKEIDNGAFAFCRKLKEINFPNSIVSLGKKYENNTAGFFQGCYNLEHVDLSNLRNINTLQDNFFSDCYSLKEVKLPIIGLQKIGYNCFFGCSSLKNLKLPNTINNFSQSIFGNSQLTSGDVPNIYLQYDGSVDEWNNIIDKYEDGLYGEKWYKYINVIVETNDGQIISYE